MAKGKNKYYVVWNGKTSGIYTSWNECQRQISGYPNAKYKGFKTRQMAETALLEGPDNYWGKEVVESTLSREELAKIGNPILNSISVDAAYNGATGEMEYQCVDTATKKVLFHEGPFMDGTNNVGEFLALVHALSYLKKNNLNIPVYSDSRNAINWVKRKKHASNLKVTPHNEKIFRMLRRAEEWLKTNSYVNKILKWETKAWGENPADFGRK